MSPTRLHTDHLQSVTLVQPTVGFRVLLWKSAFVGSAARKPFREWVATLWVTDVKFREISFARNLLRNCLILANEISQYLSLIHVATALSTAQL